MRVREQESLTGTLEVSAMKVLDGVFVVRATVENETPFPDAGAKSPEEALACSLVSPQLILQAERGSFVSLIDPPAELREVSEQCENIGAWPVLVGAAGATDTILAAPIILYDYPQIADASPGAGAGRCG
jgi:hydrogenase maturation protease